VALPFSALGIAPAAGLRLGADLALNDADSGSSVHADWAQLASFGRPDRWNDLELLPATAAPPQASDGGTGASSGAGGEDPSASPAPVEPASGCGCRTRRGGSSGTACLGLLLACFWRRRSRR
jgi:hypothetical protein